MLGLIGEHVENLPDAAISHRVLSPAELERRNPNLVRGDPYAGAIDLDQSYAWRPLPSYGSHATPVEALYQCGASTYPGPGLNAASGRIVARRLLRKPGPVNRARRWSAAREGPREKFVSKGRGPGHLENLWVDARLRSGYDRGYARTTAEPERRCCDGPSGVGGVVLYRDFSTQEELDAQYNLREAVPEFPRYKEFYEKQSRETRERLECRLDVRYGPTLVEHLDVFPAAEPGAPVLVFFHGGYWHTFSSKDFSLVAEGPVSAGVTTIVANYALCPNVTIDEIVRQSRAAVAWLYENTDGFGGDRERIYVSGHSAGGHLTAMLALTDWETDYGLPPDVIKGGCPISGLFDLRPFPYAYLQPKLQLTWDQALRNSPILNVPDAAPPLLVTYGDEETSELRRQSDDFLAAWRLKSLQGEHLPQPGKDHFSAIDGFLDASSPLCSAIFDWMGVQP